MQMLKIQEFKEYRDLGRKLDEDKLTEVIKLAELDLQNLVGNKFFYHIKNNSKDLTDLFQGSSYTQGGYIYEHQGIKSILADLAYSRLMAQINVNITAFGSTTKQSQDSTPTDRKTLFELSSQAKLDANQKWQSTKDFIKQNEELSGVYNDCRGVNQTQSYTTKFYKL